MSGLDVLLTLWLALGGAPGTTALAAGPRMDPSGLRAPLSTAGQAAEADGDIGPRMDPSGLSTPLPAADEADEERGPRMDPSG